MPELYDLMEDYGLGHIADNMGAMDPLLCFEDWMGQALSQKIRDANAMVLATTASNMQPSARVVLLKYYGPEGFVFFTNYLSRKGKELEQNPRASLLFYWPELEKQVRIEGKVGKAPSGLSDEYFNKRPEDSRINACISPQSQAIEGRNTLETLRKDYLQNNHKINRPDYWGGYILKPSKYEFWQGRENRLHDRVEFVKKGQAWKTRWLAP